MDPRVSLITIMLAALAVIGSPLQAQQRDRPVIDSGLGWNIILSDEGTLLRGVSLAWDGGDPYGSLSRNIPSAEQLRRLSTDFGVNTLHLYLEGNSSGNPSPVGVNLAEADALVQATADAGLYLIITIGCNGENGTIHSRRFAREFWSLYAPRYRDQTHVIYEAHNEPVAYTPNQWTIEDWDDQVDLYETIRSRAPETLILLCSFMGFAGDPTFGSEYLDSRGISWDNAGFAHHGYESKEGIENAIAIMQASTDFPALLSTEFWPGDTEGQRYNEMYESHLNGWMQFQWLGADDDDLDLFRSKITVAGTVWTPDDDSARWPALGSPAIPEDGSVIGVYQRAAERFIRVDPDDGNQLLADRPTYTGGLEDDAFVVEWVSSRTFRLRTPAGSYVRTSGKDVPLRAIGGSPSLATIFEWIQVPNGDHVVRARNAGGRLLRWRSGSDRIFPDGEDGRAADCRLALVTHADESPSPVVGDPYHGTPHVIPGRIQAEDFDLGGPGVSFMDSDPANNGDRYRVLEEVDIERTSDLGGGFNVGWIAEGEWLDYAVEVLGSTSDELVVDVRVASPGAGACFGLEFDGEDRAGDFEVPATGDYQEWVTITRAITLEPGVQIMRFENRGDQPFNLNWFGLRSRPCPGDFNQDDRVDGADLPVVLGSWGSCSPTCPADVTGDGIVDGADLSVVLGTWGRCP